MNPTEVRTLLSFCASVDHWLRASDQDAAALMLAGWTDLLSDVPADYAMTAAREHYRTHSGRTIQPADVLASWTAHRREEQRTEEQAHRRDAAALPAPQETLVPVGTGVDYLRAMLAATAAGRDPGTVPRPAGVRVLSRDADLRSRRCVYHDLCACDHETCRDGFRDDPVVIVNGLGREYEGVRRCPFCLDALRLAEDRGRAKRPRAGGRPVGATR